MVIVQRTNCQKQVENWFLVGASRFRLINAAWAHVFLREIPGSSRHQNDPEPPEIKWEIKFS